MKQILILTVVFFTGLSFAQKKQIILISSKYDFQKESNSYNINNMLKSILISNNFEVYFDNEILPVPIAQNRCNALTGVLVDKSNILITKLKFQITDCQNKLVFETEDVKSRDKNVQSGYIEAIKLLSPELKKFNPSLLKKTELVVAAPLVEAISDTVLKYQLVEINNGFILLDTSLKTKLQLYKTTNPTVFIADKFGVKGVFTKSENKGVFEYYLNDKLVVEEYLF